MAQFHFVEDYAKTKAPKYEFLLHRELSIPQADSSAHMIGHALGQAVALLRKPQ